MYGQRAQLHIELTGQQFLPPASLGNIFTGVSVHWKGGGVVVMSRSRLTKSCLGESGTAGSVQVLSDRVLSNRSFLPLLDARSKLDFLGTYYCPCTKYEGRYWFKRCLLTFGGGSTPSQVWSGGYPIPGPGGGVLHLRSGQGGTPGYPPSRTGWGVNLPPPPTTTRRQSSIASTCYAAGGMPLAFTQEDFLVWN